jgi:hypothetical protein
LNPVTEALMLARANDRLVALSHEEAPRSWSKEAKFAFLHLQPALQAYYVAREKDRDREVRRCQNEAAKARKALLETQQQLAEAQRALAAIQQPKEDNSGITEQSATA